MKLKIKRSGPGWRWYFCYLAGQADHIIQPGGFQQDALKRLAGTQPRRAVDSALPVPNTIRQWLRLDCLSLGSHPFPATSSLEPEPQARNWHRYAELRRPGIRRPDGGQWSSMPKLPAR